MSEKINTPLGKMSKKADLILGILIFISAISYGILRFKFPNYEDRIHIICGIVILICTCVMAIWRAKEPPTDVSEEFEEAVNDYSEDIDAKKKSYRGSWSAIEEWKQGMLERADELKLRLKKEGETEDVLDVWATWDLEMQNGIEAIQNSNNPLLAKKETKKDEGEHEEQDEAQSEMSTLGKKILSLLILIPLLFLYLVLSTLECSIFLLTVAFAYFFFPNGIPLAILPSPYVIPLAFSGSWSLNKSRLKFISFSLKHLIGIIIMSVFGYYLNQWTYAQSGEVQIAVTVALPIIYAIIYYKLKHKKAVREI
ncbi:MAG: hypothetical protein SPL08_04490 [Pseudomonadota bacterium]|nr:hypothetical protein [Pseudomonadota bacterium]